MKNIKFELDKRKKVEDPPALRFLKKKGLIKEGHTTFVIRFTDGSERVELCELLEEFAKQEQAGGTIKGILYGFEIISNEIKKRSKQL